MHASNLKNQSIASNRSKQANRFADHLIPRGVRTFARITATAALTMTIVVGVALTYGTPADWFCNITFTGRMP
jgi:hypothetical protein